MYRPFTGIKCSCKKGTQRDNCPTCEGTGKAVDFKKIREYNQREQQYSEIFQLFVFDQIGGYHA